MKSKKFLNKSFASLLTIAIVVLVLTSCNKKEEKVIDQKFHIITSTIEGGTWSNVKTWQEGTVPNEFTDVNITGKVSLTDTATCLNLMVDVGAHLIVEKTGYLKIMHHAINEGTIINNGKIELNEEEK